MSDAGPGRQGALADALVATARAWRDPDHPARAAAVQAALAGPQRWTAEGVGFELNRLTHALTAKAVRGQVGGEWEGGTPPARVAAADAAPLAGLEAVLGALLRGYGVTAELDGAAQAFVAAWAEAAGGLPVGFTLRKEAVIASRGVALLTGHEGPDALSGLAEDVLLHDGRARRSVALVFAPASASPDLLLAALDAFRALIPAHPAADGALRMPRAFLAAAKQPHAWGDGYLISRGDPEWLGEGHVRWAAYTTRDEAEAWVRAHADEVSVVVAERGGTVGGIATVEPGSAHRRRLDLRPPRATDGA